MLITDRKRFPLDLALEQNLSMTEAALAYPVTHGFPDPSPLPPNLLQIGQRKHIHSGMHIRSCKDFSLFVSASLVPIRGFRRIKEKVPCFSRSHQDTKV